MSAPDPDQATQGVHSAVSQRHPVRGYLRVYAGAHVVNACKAVVNSRAIAGFLTQRAAILQCLFPDSWGSLERDLAARGFEHPHGTTPIGSMHSYYPKKMNTAGGIRLG